MDMMIPMNMTEHIDDASDDNGHDVYGEDNHGGNDDVYMSSDGGFAAS